MVAGRAASLSVGRLRRTGRAGGAGAAVRGDVGRQPDRPAAGWPAARADRPQVRPGAAPLHRPRKPGNARRPRPRREGPGAGRRRRCRWDGRPVSVSASVAAAQGRLRRAGGPGREPGPEGDRRSRQPAQRAARRVARPGPRRRGQDRPDAPVARGKTSAGNRFRQVRGAAVGIAEQVPRPADGPAPASSCRAASTATPTGATRCAWRSAATARVTRRFRT